MASTSDLRAPTRKVGLCSVWVLFATLPGCVPISDSESPGSSDTEDTPDYLPDQPERPGPDETDPTDPPAAEGLCHVTLECGGGILDEPKTPCGMEVVDHDGTPMYDGAAGLELRGRSSMYFPKKQYSVELRTHSELPEWPDSNWAYLDDGSDQGTAWRDPAYDDSAWATGPAPLGYNGDWLQTTVRSDHGPGNPSVTTYFRDHFTLSALASITHVDLGLLVHDGAVVFLNGVEVARVNLPAPANYDTPATRDVATDDYGWITAEIDPGLLVDGTNTLAVEVHRDPDGTDLRFNLWLEASGADQPTDLFGMGSEEDWILNGQYVDRSLFRNRLAFDLFQGLGGTDRYATETRFCELDLDGEYLGIYTLGEKLDRDDDRIDITEGIEPGESFIIKLGDSAGFHDNAVGYGTWELVWPDPDPEAEAAVSEWLVGWEDAIHSGDPGDPTNGIFAWVDLDSAVDWVLVQELMKNHDAYQLSVWLWKDVTGTMHFAPWDLDLSMGYPYSDCGAEGFVSRTAHDRDGNAVSLEFVDAMASVPEFHDALIARWQELRQTAWTEEALLERIAGYDAILAPAIDANFSRWPIDDIVFQTDDPDVENWLCPVSSYDDEHDRVVEFLSERLIWLDQNIDTF